MPSCVWHLEVQKTRYGTYKKKVSLTFCVKYCKENQNYVMPRLGLEQGQGLVLVLNFVI